MYHKHRPQWQPIYLASRKGRLSTPYMKSQKNQLVCKLGATTLSIKSFSIMTLSLTIHNPYSECHYAECRVLFIVMLNVLMLSVIMVNVFMLSVVMLSVVALVTHLSIGHLYIFLSCRLAHFIGNTIFLTTDKRPSFKKFK